MPHLSKSNYLQALPIAIVFAMLSTKLQLRMQRSWKHALYTPTVLIVEYYDYWRV